MRISELEKSRRDRALDEAAGMIAEELPVLRELRCGSPGSVGDAPLAGKIAADGSFTPWFVVGNAVGTNPVRPERG